MFNKHSSNYTNHPPILIAHIPFSQANIYEISGKKYMHTVQGTHKNRVFQTTEGCLPLPPFVIKTMPPLSQNNLSDQLNPLGFLTVILVYLYSLAVYFKGYVAAEALPAKGFSGIFFRCWQLCCFSLLLKVCILPNPLLTAIWRFPKPGWHTLFACLILSHFGVKYCVARGCRCFQLVETRHPF